MKLPPDTIIDPRKATHYLLVWRAKGDKSAFLGRAGYTLATSAQLIDDLRAQILPHAAVPMESTGHGSFTKSARRSPAPTGERYASARSG